MPTAFVASEKSEETGGFSKVVIFKYEEGASSVFYAFQVIKTVNNDVTLGKLFESCCKRFREKRRI